MIGHDDWTSRLWFRTWRARVLALSALIRGAVLLASLSLEAVPLWAWAHVSGPAAPSPSLQLGASSVNSASSSLVDHGGFPSLAGIALEQRLEDGANEHAVTVDLSPLGVLALAHRIAGGAQGDSRPPAGLGRVAARITVGGPPQFVDSLRLARAGRWTDHVTSELKLRLIDGRATRTGSPVDLALALTADNLGTGFGLDRYGATLIADGSGPWSWTANAGYRWTERYHAATRLEETKLGLATRWRLPRAAPMGPASLEISGACLVRNQGRAPVWQGAALLEAPLLDGVRLLVGLRLADRPEVEGDGRARVVLGLARGACDSPR